MFEDQIDIWLKEEHYKKELFLKTVELMDDFNYPFFLIYGTMLGAVRDHRLLPYDDDLDILICIGDAPWCVPEKDLDVCSLVRESLKYGLKRANYGHHYKLRSDSLKSLECKDWPEILKLPTDQHTKVLLDKMDKELKRKIWYDRLVFEWKNQHIDVWFYHQSSPSYRRFYSEPKTVELFGRTFLIPGPETEANFLMHFGPKWREVFCSYPLFQKYYKQFKEGVTPEEVKVFMKEFRERDKLYKAQKEK